MKSNKLSKVLTSPPRLVFRNAKSLKDRLIKSKLKPESDVATGNLKVVLSPSKKVVFICVNEIPL